MGRLAISRGYSPPEPAGEVVPFALVADVVAPPAVEPADPLAAVHARLEALERLSRLCEAGALTVDEFLVEKAAILGHPRSNLLGPPAETVNAAPVTVVPAQPRRGRSLAARLGWLILPLGVVAGVGLSAMSQPEATASAWQEASRLFGL